MQIAATLYRTTDFTDSKHRLSCNITIIYCTSTLLSDLHAGAAVKRNLHKIISNITISFECRILP